jgi:carbon monoxide dehydrogenase subunit G
MNVEGKKLIDATQEATWNALINPDVLRATIPGCKSFEQLTDTTYRFEIELKVAAIVGAYKGEIEILDPQPPSKYGLSIAGSGALGHMKSTVWIELLPLDDKTEMIYKGEAEVGGKVAKVGQRVLSSVAGLVTNQFFNSFAKQIKVHN